MQTSEPNGAINTPESRHDFPRPYQRGAERFDADAFPHLSANCAGESRQMQISSCMILEQALELWSAILLLLLDGISFLRSVTHARSWSKDFTNPGSS
jgi:hypothetical protein